MPTIQFPNIADDLRTLPATGIARARALRRLVDLAAADEAAVSLQNASGRAGKSVSATAIAAAAAVLTGDDSARERLREAVSSPEFAAALPAWVRELRAAAGARPDSGACTTASALDLWGWTMEWFRSGEGARGEGARTAVDELTEAVAPLLAARNLALEVVAKTGGGSPAELQLRADLAQSYAASAAAAAGSVCAELVFGYRRHLTWDAEGCGTCYAADALDDLEGIIPGIASGARMSSDVIEADGSHAAKRGPCVRFDGVDTFMRLRTKLDGCLTGARIAKDRAATALAATVTSR